MFGEKIDILYNPNLICRNKQKMTKKNQLKQRWKLWKLRLLKLPSQYKPN